jgi:hypothetical protein
VVAMRARLSRPPRPRRRQVASAFPGTGAGSQTPDGLVQPPPRYAGSSSKLSEIELMQYRRSVGVS